MDFQDVELAVLVKFISEITGRNFILDERVKGKVTIISPGKISVEEAYAVFQSVLQVKNFTTVPSGSIIKILGSQEAKSATIDTVLPGGASSLTDEFITKLIPMKNVDVNNMLPIVQPLVSPNGLLAAYTATNLMILIDSASNIARIGKILRELDVPGFERDTDVVRLNYAFAAEVAAVIAQVLETPASGQQQQGLAPRAAAPPPAARPGAAAAARRPGAAPGQSSTITSGGDGQGAYKIIPDERTNSLIVVAGPLEMNKIRDLIVRLDVPLRFGTGRIHVHYLKYANAFEIVPVLSDLIGGGGGGGAGGLGGGLLGRSLGGSTAFRGGRLGQRGGLGGLAGNLGGGGLGGLGGLGGGGLGGLGGGGLGGGFGSNSQRGGAAGSLGRGGGSFGGGIGGLGGLGGGGSVTGGGSGEFEGLVRITADPSTNALIVNASPQDFETLKRVIEQLDVRRRQVYVEAIILEVRLETQRALGIELQGVTGINNGVAIGRTNFGNINSFLDPTRLTGIPGLLAAAASNQTVRLPNGTVVPAQVALLTAAQGNTDVNILSAPNILTTDNREAEIVVGQNIPFLASRSTSETNLANTFSTIERRDVGITLRLTPQISEGGMVRMDLFQEVSAVIPSSVIDANQLGPSTTIRSATTSVVVRNAQTVVIGGLISDDISNQENSIPFLSEIPIIGNLLRSSNVERRKINLLIFLTPHIVLDAQDHRDLSLEQRGKIRAFMEDHHFRNLRREQLDTPNWDPPLPPRRPPGEDDEADGRSEPPARSEWDKPVAAERPDPQRDTAARNQLLDPPAVNRYVLLASFSERGTAPPALQSASGLVAIALPDDSALTTLFRKGEQYRFQNDNFQGLYRCLEAYPGAYAAQLVYPEGLPVDAAKGEYLHWRDLADVSSANIGSWSALH